MKRAWVDNLKSNQPVRCVLVGGFLGSGKTTALRSIASALLGQGVQPGIIVNDQSTDLVDTSLLRGTMGKEVPIAEVGNGCFCCQFESLGKAVRELSAYGVDVLLGEPVGSCTDLIATVVNPLKAFYPNILISPFSVLLDPQWVKELLLHEIESSFPEEVVFHLSYLMRQQMEEADILVLNKIDLLVAKEIKRLEEQISERFPHKPVLAISAKEGQGVSEWLSLLFSGVPSGQHPLQALDYDRYAKAEAMLGWLNEQIRIVGCRLFDADMFVMELMAELRKTLVQHVSDIAHLKVILIAEQKTKRANLTHINEEPSFSEESIGLVGEAHLILNARVPLAPERLEILVSEAINIVGKTFDVQISVLASRSFSPPYPHPSYRMT